MRRNVIKPKLRHFLIFQKFIKFKTQIKTEESRMACKAKSQIMQAANQAVASWLLLIQARQGQGTVPCLPALHFFRVFQYFAQEYGGIEARRLHLIASYQQFVDRRKWPKFLLQKQQKQLSPRICAFEVAHIRLEHLTRLVLYSLDPNWIEKYQKTAQNFPMKYFPHQEDHFQDEDTGMPAKAPRLSKKGPRNLSCSRY